MLLKLLPDQSTKYWDSIKSALLASPPPASEWTSESLNNVLAKLIDGTMQCWISYKRSERGSIVEGIVLTTPIVDLCSNTRNLLIYCIHTYDSAEMRTWTEGAEALLKYARSLGCSYIIGYSMSEDWKALAERFGGKTSYMMFKSCREES